MLELKNITKKYEMGEVSISALENVNVSFGEKEFVAVLGTSGSGKTTMLNVIGGLDRYDSGELIINGRATSEFKARDWDTYRNHSIGFVFQSYNLIPHQTVLANVELALTLSGVSKAERRKRAFEVLEKVGLGDQARKKPGQMSGGQMQRVAIARALVNNPEILLADEPTGALDTETSRQILELLSEIAHDKLVIMVTHNAELADSYATRIVRLRDGKIISDEANTPTDGLSAAAVIAEGGTQVKGRKKQTSMSFFTALSLSMRNLMTKKARTFLTSFAGSIGIIGIALILSLSNGIQLYIDGVQRDTLSSYPISIQAEQIDMQSLFTSMTDIDTGAGKGGGESTAQRDEGKIYGTLEASKMMDAMNDIRMKGNNLKPFKEYLDSKEELDSLTSAVVYGYDVEIPVYGYDLNGKLLQMNPTQIVNAMYSNMGFDFDYSNSSMASLYEEMYDIKVWSEIMPGKNGELVNPIIEDQYTLVDGAWPKDYSEVILIVNENNELSDVYLYALGILDQENISAKETEDAGELVWETGDFIGRTFNALLPTDRYADTDGDGVWSDMSENAEYMEIAAKSGTELKISGIVRQTEGKTAGALTGAVGYTHALGEYIIEKTNESEIIREQRENPDIDVLNGLPFKTEDEDANAAEKAAAVLEYAAKLSEDDKAAMYIEALSEISDEQLKAYVTEQMMQFTDRSSMEESVIAEYMKASGMSEETIRGYLDGLSDEQLREAIQENVAAMIKRSYSETVMQQLAAVPAAQLAAQLDDMLSGLGEEQLAEFHDKYLPKSVSESTYDDNIKLLGAVDAESPSSVSIYPSSFEAKEKISQMIEEYNSGVSEENKINYTDFIALILTSVTTIINAISTVLISFVAISLVVSSIMIGIITYISVLERTKEIGILRAIGASKRDISRVFNAETLVVGLISGLLGIGITLLLCIPTNVIIKALTDIPGVAVLPWGGGVILVVISMLLTFIAGLIPSRLAAKKDPVIALRSE